MSTSCPERLVESMKMARGTAAQNSPEDMPTGHTQQWRLTASAGRNTERGMRRRASSSCGFTMTVAWMAAISRLTQSCRQRGLQAFTLVVPCRRQEMQEGRRLIVCLRAGHGCLFQTGLGRRATRHAVSLRGSRRPAQDWAGASSGASPTGSPCCSGAWHARQGHHLQDALRAAWQSKTGLQQRWD